MVLDVMMPFYGRFDHFRIAVESVLAQTSSDWRLVIVDDVYPDTAPGEWAASIDDPRVTYLRNEENLGTSRNYRKCVDLMVEPFGMLMGCDDRMRPDFVARVLELISDNPGASVIQPGVEVMDAEGDPSAPLADRVKRLYRPRGRGVRTLQGEEFAQSVLRGNWTYFPSLVWRVETIARLGFRLDLPVVQDLAMLVEIAKTGGGLVVDDRVVFDYRRHATSVSSVTGTDGSKFGQERVLFSEAARDLGELGWSGASRAARHHLSSRLNALTELPRSWRVSDARGRRALLHHVLGRTR